jgi:hypothetical protein
MVGEGREVAERRQRSREKCKPFEGEWLRRDGRTEE